MMKIGCVLAVCAAALNGTAAPSYRHFELGVGDYGGSGGLDTARKDWLYLGLGNCVADKPTADYLNSLNEINPKMKFVIRLWPKPGYRLPKDDPKGPGRYITHFAYKYHKEAREAFLKECRAELDNFYKYLKHPENIYGYTLFEELPHQFGGNVAILDTAKPGTPVNGDMIQFAAEYKAETGKELKEWNLDTRRWWAKTFAWSIRDVYSSLKKDYPKLKGFVYFMSHYRPLDWLEPGEAEHAFRVLPCKWSDMVEPGVAADGFFAYNNCETWTKRYQKLATDHHWPYFSQLSHSSAMRNASWEECVAAANADLPENLGYFYYDWDFSCGAWNDDPEVAPDDVPDYAGRDNRGRRYLASIDLNMDIVRRHLTPTVTFGHDLGPTELNGYAMVPALIVNNRTTKWFKNEKEATLFNVKAKLEVPPEFSIPGTVSCPPEVTIRKMLPGEAKTVTWWVRRDKASPDPQKIPVTLTVRSDGVEPVVVTRTKPVDFPEPPASFDIRKSGDVFRYVNWGVDWGAFPVEVTVTPAGGMSQVVDPAIQLGSNRLKWRGQVPQGKRLVLGPDFKATLCDSSGKNPKDVTENLVGEPFKTGKGISTFTYFDDYTDTGYVKAKIGVKLITK